MDDRAIVALFFARDGDAVAEAQTAYGRYCRAVAKNITGSDEDAEECVNDALLAAWNSIPPARPESLRGYLGKLTRNIAINRWERSRASKRGGGEADLCLDELADILPSGDAPPETEVLFRDLMTRFVLSLGPEEREIFLFRYRNVETVSEIARITGKSPGAVKIALFRCRKKLRGYLKKEGIDV